MNMKKILAAATASVLSVSAMAVVASADGLMTKKGNSEGATTFDISFEGLTEEQVASITKIEATITLDSDYANGCIGINNAGSWDGGDQMELSGSGAFTRNVTAGSLVSYDDDGNLAPFAQVQFWWINNIPDTENEGTAVLESVKLYDASGNEVVPGAAAPDETSTETPDETSTETPDETSTETPDETSTETPAETPTETTTTGTDDTKTNTDTGVEGVAAVLGVAVVAAGAMVVAKKRK